MSCRAAACLSTALLAACASTTQPADLLLTNGVVYLGDRPTASVVAIRGDRISHVGNSAVTARRTIDLGGRLLLPGLHDVHIHPLSIVPPGGCDLDSTPYSLASLVPRLQRCLSAGAAEQTGWLMVNQWNFTVGNQPTVAYPTMRRALDVVSETVPIMLLGNDGHHGAVNSAALARARDQDGSTIGLNHDTLASTFAHHRPHISVDIHGEPNGYVNESARELFGAPGSVLFEIPPPHVLPAVADKLARNGITSVRDASARVESLQLYDALYASGRQTFRVSLALHPNFKDYVDATGHPDVARIVEDFSVIRERYADHPLISANTVKIFIDGVLEGNPRTMPPTLPSAAMLEPYRQPIFADKTDLPSIVGYVDPSDPACRSAQTAEPADFLQLHGFHPDQCRVFSGVLEHSREVIEDYIVSFDRAGFTVHAHAIGDRAVRTAVDTLAKTRLRNGRITLPHSLAHAQLVHPDDIPRIGRLGLDVAFTYAWMLPDLAYDLTVTPFVDLVDDETLYAPGGYTMQNSYPAGRLLAAGAVLTAGSDAPVDTREPRPFVNIQQAITRADENGIAFNAAERIDIHAVLAAYTVNGARALRQEGTTGAIAVGMKADLCLLDQNIVELANSGRAAEIGDTQVLMTVFDGKIVWQAPGFAAANDER